MKKSFTYLGTEYLIKDWKTEAAVVIYFDIFYPLLKATHTKLGQNFFVDYYLRRKSNLKTKAKVKVEADWVVPHLRKTYPMIEFMEL